ncbi:MAG: cytidine deaminase [Actinomycetes bacterium]
MSEGALDPSTWVTLRKAAVRARAHSYAPYSNFPVGAAGLTDDGRIVTGGNVENASLGVTLCAECSLVSDFIRTRRTRNRGRIIALAIVGPEANPLMPCGRCRQLLHEHGGPTLLIDHRDNPIPLSLLIPEAFDGSQLFRSGQ